jgi:hypothetical protein
MLQVGTGTDAENFPAAVTVMRAAAQAVPRYRGRRIRRAA